MMLADEMARRRDAMRDLTTPSERVTIVETDSMVLVTGADGRTTRLSPDGKKVKDENTGIERKTKWDSGKLVSEISGLGPGKATQTFAADPEHHQLKITVQMEGRGGSNQPRTTSLILLCSPRLAGTCTSNKKKRLPSPPLFRSLGSLYEPFQLSMERRNGT